MGTDKLFFTYFMTVQKKKMFVLKCGFIPDTQNQILFASCYADLQ